MNENKFFEFWNKLNTGEKMAIIALLIGLLMCIIGGTLLGIPSGTILFNFKPLAVTLIVAGGLIVFLMLMALLVLNI
jgi:hypothetical protein